MDRAAAARIQATQAKSGQDTSKDSFPARAQSAAARNEKAKQSDGQSGAQGSGGNNTSGGSGGNTGNPGSK